MINDEANEWLEEIHFGSELQPDTVAEVRALCLEYKDCSAKSFLDLEVTPQTKFHIELRPGATPVCCGRPRRFAPRELNFIKRQLYMLTRAGLISRWEGDCEWLSGVDFPPKKDDYLRFCCSYVGLNARTVTESYPQPRIDEILEDLAGHDWYFIFDRFSGYYAMELTCRGRPYWTLARPPSTCSGWDGRSTWRQSSIPGSSFQLPPAGFLRTDARVHPHGHKTPPVGVQSQGTHATVHTHSRDNAGKRILA